MTDKQKYLQEFIKETVKEMIDDGELLLVRDTNNRVGLAYKRKTPEGEVTRTSYANDLDDRKELQDWGILSAEY